MSGNDLKGDLQIRLSGLGFAILQGDLSSVNAKASGEGKAQIVGANGLVDVECSDESLVEVSGDMTKVTLRGSPGARVVLSGSTQVMDSTDFHGELVTTDLQDDLQDTIPSNRFQEF